MSVRPKRDTHASRTTRTPGACAIRNLVFEHFLSLHSMPINVSLTLCGLDVEPNQLASQRCELRKRNNILVPC